MNLRCLLLRPLPSVQSALGLEAGVDGWLMYDFRGINPIATDCFVSRE
jgi:hypothetical protein